MNRLRQALIVPAFLAAASSLVSCKRSTEPPSPGSTGSAVGQDVKGVAKEAEKTAKDLGRATADLANKASEHGDDAWITTKVKSELTAQGFDPLHVHVDTAGGVVTLSGSVDTAADARKAVTLAKAVKDVARVEDHLFVKPDRR